LIAKAIESETFRGITIRIDDSDFFRWFTRVHDKEMMDFTTLNKLANCIQPETWTRINDRLGHHAVETKLIAGDKLRLYTTAVETNIHWPTDSSLLWDVYRVLARLIERAREIDARLVGNRRLQVKRVKKVCLLIGRQAARKGAESETLQAPYKRLLSRVEAVLEWARAIADGLEKKADGYCLEACALSARLTHELRNYVSLGNRAVDQARRRVIAREQVPNEEKLFSIFEPHTELLKRGKAGKPLEFGHMVLLQQVQGNFISGYRVFERRPVEHGLVEPALKSHKKLFGEMPKVVAADKGFYGSMSKLAEFQRDVEVVAIPKKGGRSEQETAREHHPLFKMAQQFRAGIEGSISFLKRCLRLLRCFNKGLKHYEATVGLTIFAHNLIVLARDST
jgi:IS5 family transposase